MANPRPQDTIPCSFCGSKLGEEGVEAVFSNEHHCICSLCIYGLHYQLKHTHENAVHMREQGRLDS